VAGTSKVAVNDTGVLVFDQGGLRTRLIVRNFGASTAYLAFSNPATTNDFPLKADEAVIVSPISKEQDLYAICSAGQTTDLRLIWA
jgi:hypothetical protein